MDFESPDEIEKPKRQSIPHKKADFGNISPKKLPGEDDMMKPEYDYDDIVSQESTSDYEAEPFHELQIPSSESMDESQSDMEEETPQAGFRRIDEMPAQTIYASPSDKSPKKRLIIKDNKVIKAKTPKKEKGKAKMTAYMLWAREQRAKILLETPKLDFASISKRLSELWACVTTSEKDAWQRRAKRLNSKLQPFAPEQPDAGRANKKFISHSPSQRGTGGGVKFGAGGHTPGGSYQLGVPNVGNTLSPDSPRSREVAKPGIKPIDVAAHLKLLGESLTIIGERLKEHEGQIAVSGSLSVLLDSLLCALGPLLCLTQQVPELQENCCTPEQLTKIVDNVAFIMPGL